MPRDPWIRRIEPCRVAYRATTYKDVEQAMKRRPDEAPRPKLIALLKSAENMSARERRERHPAYDFGWMWGELGLERPG
jgi:hypothetical protein